MEDSVTSFVSAKTQLVKFSSLVTYNPEISLADEINQQMPIDSNKNNKINEVLHWGCYVLLAAGFLFLMSVKSHAGLLSSWIGSTQQEAIHNPCSDSDFRQQYGRYCSGFLKKEIRCLSEGRNPGVCDSAAVCDAGQSVARKLCEKHCLNTSPQKLGNQYIQINCIPRVAQEQNAPIEQSPTDSPIPGQENPTEGVKEINISNTQNEFEGDHPFETTNEEILNSSQPESSPPDKAKPNEGFNIPPFFEAYPSNIRHYFWGAPD